MLIGTKNAREVFTGWSPSCAMAALGASDVCTDRDVWVVCGVDARPVNDKNEYTAAAHGATDLLSRKVAGGRCGRTFRAISSLMRCARRGSSCIQPKRLRRPSAAPETARQQRFQERAEPVRHHKCDEPQGQSLR